MKSRYSKHFTLIELLIVICIIGILAGLVSTAILKITRTAVEKRNQNNAKRLEAAIMEYWHDMGRWPIPEDIKPVLKKSGQKIVDWQGDKNSDANKTAGYAFTVVFKGDKQFKRDNSEVVEKLMNALLPDKMTHKDFLDLHGFSVPAEDPVSKWPTSALVDAFDAYNGNATDADGNELQARKKPVLAYQAAFIECPHCGHAYSVADGRETCNFDGDGDGKPDCTYFQQNQKVYYFSKEDRKHPIRLALPYTIEIDLANNTVTVEADPGHFIMK